MLMQFVARTALLLFGQLNVRHASMSLCDPHTDLCRWADAHGVQRSVHVGPSKFGGNGLVATKAMAARAEALRVPLSLCLGVTRDDDYLFATQLAMKLHNGEAEEYRRALPPPPSVLHRWHELDLAALQNATLASEAARWRETRRAQYELASQSEADASIGESRFNDLYDIVAARTLGARGDTTDTLRLVPLVSMAQHSCTAGGQFAVRDNCFCLLSGQACDAGGEIFLDYGSRTSDEFLLQYGFVPDRNRHDAATISLGTLAGAAVAHVDWTSVETASSDVRDACSAMLEEMPTSLATDIELLRAAERESEAGDATSSEEYKMALRYRIAKKQLLTAVAGVPAVTAATSAFARL